MEYSKIIRQRRKQLGATQEEVADVSDVSLSFYKMLEKGYANPSVTTLERILDSLGLELQIYEKRTNTFEQ
jgi:transcriptional regulator with XRE-family HTH domain